MQTTLVPAPTKTADPTSHEVDQFCDLLARIYMRCLQEQNPQVLARLAITTSGQQEANHAAA